MKKHRPKISVDTQERLLHDSDHRCSKCYGPDHDVQVHHIDGNPANNDDENLIVLCLNCHSEIERKGGLGKKYTAGELRKYRTSWEQEVARRRIQTLEFDSTLAVFEIKKLSNRIQAIPFAQSREEEAIELLRIMSNWCEFAPHNVRHEATSSVYSATYRVMHDKASSEYVGALAAILSNCLPFFSLVLPQPKPINPIDLKLFQHVADTAYNLVNSACKYISDPFAAEESFHLLGDVLRLGILNDLPGIKEQLNAEFKECIRVARHPRHIQMLEQELRDAYEVTEFYKSAERNSHDQA